MVRPEVVERLIRAANDGLTEAAEGTTSSEVLSACLTLTRYCIRAVLEINVDPQAREQARAGILDGIMLLIKDAEGEQTKMQ